MENVQVYAPFDASHLAAFGVLIECPVFSGDVAILLVMCFPERNVPESGISEVLLAETVTSVEYGSTLVVVAHDFHPPQDVVGQTFRIQAACLLHVQHGREVALLQTSVLYEVASLCFNVFSRFIVVIGSCAYSLCACLLHVAGILPVLQGNAFRAFDEGKTDVLPMQGGAGHALPLDASLMGGDIYAVYAKSSCAPQPDLLPPRCFPVGLFGMASPQDGRG